MGVPLSPIAHITYASGVTVASNRLVAHMIHILDSGWLRVCWLDGEVTYLSPSVVREIAGPGVIYE